ncbi:MAG: beta-ketoacyl-ACP synthase III [Candidatus Sumerlaeia bacterium]|nr:beta-ketoacyl-ACP synthase III [Candidatus Sumerlaeia bacterium]
MNRNIGIKGVGYCVPDKVLSNADLEKLVDTNDEWIVERTGIRERRVLSEGENCSTIGAEAARRALAHAGMTIDDIDLIVCATFSPDYLCPATACVIHSLLKPSKHIPAFDVNGACTGFIMALQVAQGMMTTMGYKNVLVIGAEACTRFIDYSNRSVCILFGDGAGAAVIGDVEAPAGFLGHSAHADSTGVHLISIDAGGSACPISQKAVDERLGFIQVEGREVYKFAVKVLGTAVDQALANAGMTPDQIDFLIPHQANIRIIDAAAKRYNMPMERVVCNVERFGNTSAASVPIALAEAWEQGRIKPGMVLAMVAFGGGLTYGSTIVRV